RDVHLPPWVVIRVYPFSAPTENGYTLITTQGGRWTSLGAIVDVEPLDGDEALALLAGSDPRRRADGNARQLVAELGGHPLALELAAALIANTRGEDPVGFWLSRIRGAG